MCARRCRVLASLELAADGRARLQYNLYFDKLLGTDVFPESVYRMLDAFYPTVAGASCCPPLFPSHSSLRSHRP